MGLLPSCPATLLNHLKGEGSRPSAHRSHEILLEANEWGSHLAALAPEEKDTIYLIPHRYPKGEYLLVYDPIDGSSNIDVNLNVGTIFSVLEEPEGASTRDIQDEDASEPHSRVLQEG